MRAEAQAEADRALALDPHDADAYVAKYLLAPASDWAGQEAILRKAVAVNPDWPHANGFLGLTLAATGRLREAVDYLQRATTEDRPGQNWEGASAIELAAVGRVSDADAEYAEMLRYWPDSPDDWYPRDIVRVAEHRWDDLLAVLDEPVASKVLDPATLARAREYVEAAKTRAPAALQAARRDYIAAAGDGPSLVVSISVLSDLGFVDDAFALAARYQPGQSLTGMRSDFLFLPATAPMRRDPRFLQLAGRIGLLQFWRQTGKWPDFCAEPSLPYVCK
jgi:tetratricopeptide (TPR) repeat protein